MSFLDEVDQPCRDGSIVNTEVKTTYLQNERGDLEIIGITRDITERKQAEEALRAASSYNRRLIEASIDPLVVIGPDGKITDVNEATETVTGVLRKQLIGDDFSNYFTEPEKAKEGYQKVLAEGFVRNYPLTIRQPSGKTTDVLYNATVYKNKAGEIEGIFAAARDISESKRAEQALYEQQQVFRTLVENSPDIIARYDRDCRRIYVNPAYLKTAQIPLQELLTTSPIQVSPLPTTSARILQNLIRKVLDSGVAEAIDVIWPKADNNDYWYNIYASPEFDREGQVVSVITVSRDITERKQAEEEIRKLNATLEQRVEERTRELRNAQEQLVRQEKLAVLGQLAGSVGHELRNPLGVIANSVYFLRMAQPDASEKVREYLDLIEKHVHISDMIIADLLDFTRVKSVDREPIAIDQLIQQTLERFPPPDFVEVKLDLPDNLSQAYADPQHIIQVLGNFTLNACQAMSKQGGTLAISAHAQDGMIGISVRDTGTGISPENMKKLFEPLFTTKPKGIGLGLAVSKKLIEANSGRIEVQSEAGKGSTFTVYLPVKAEGAPP
jgi:PAS domain S-box-containing protein